MLKTIIIDGDKGGVGKTTVSRAIAHAYISKTEGLPDAKIICLDADHANPDFCGPGGYKKDEHIHQIGIVNLHDPSAWIDLLNALESTIESADQNETRIILSMPAGARQSIFSAPEAQDALQMLNAITVWAMGPTSDSVTQLHERFNAAPSLYEFGVVLPNLFFGPRHRFEEWDRSDIRKEIVGNGWTEVSMPVLTASIAAKLGRTPFHVALATGMANGNRLGMGDMMALRAFLKRTADIALAAENAGNQ